MLRVMRSISQSHNNSGNNMRPSNSTHIKLDVELILQEVVDVPALAKPPGAVLVGLQPKPVVVRVLVLAHVLVTERGRER